MRVGALAAIAIVSACGSDAPEPVAPISIQPPARKAAPAAACIKVPEEEPGAIKHASGDATHVQYCVGTAIDQCFTLELATAKLTRLPGQPKAQSPAIQEPAHLETTNPELKVCNANGCKTLTPKVWPGAAPLRAATNGAVAAVMLGDAEAGKGYVEVYDVMRAKKLASFKYARGEFKCGDIGMLGDTIYVVAHACQKPSGRAALYTQKGKKLANVGGKPDFGMYGNTYTQVEDNVWAFLEENGHRIALQDVAKGKVVKMIDVSELFAIGPGQESGPDRSVTRGVAAKIGNPGESTIIRLNGGRIAVIAGTPAHGSVAVVDVMSGEVKIVRPPICS